MQISSVVLTLLVSISSPCHFGLLSTSLCVWNWYDYLSRLRPSHNRFFFATHKISMSVLQMPTRAIKMQFASTPMVLRAALANKDSLEME